jgi:hypothetical protein
MAMRAPAGFISAFFDPLKNPNAPTAPSASGGDASATVSFTAPANVGGSAITEYQAVAYTGSTYVSNTAGATSPISVTGLTNGTAYTFNVWALNSYGPGPWSVTTNSVTPAIINRGFWIGGVGSSSVIQYVEIATTGNTSSFGTLSPGVNSAAACGSSTRIVVADDTVMQYFGVSSFGSSSSFGTLGLTIDGGVACNSSTRGIFSNGDPSNIAYITIATTGNSTAFGILTQTRQATSSCSSPTRGVFGGGVQPASPFTRYNTIDYITIATTGNAVSFGSLSVARAELAACSTSTRGVFAGGDSPSSYSNLIDYITIASTGNATTFGQLTQRRYDLSGCSSSTRGVFGGGNSPTGNSNVMDYITIASTGDAVSFGNLAVVSGQQITSASNCNGGTQ